jgi:hypothetical protein
MTSRRFPAPWRADKITGGYVVRDANGQALAHIYSRDSEAEALQAKVLTKDEARRIAVNIARLLELLGNTSSALTRGSKSLAPGRKMWPPPGCNQRFDVGRHEWGALAPSGPSRYDSWS